MQTSLIPNDAGRKTCQSSFELPTRKLKMSKLFRGILTSKFCEMVSRNLFLAFSLVMILANLNLSAAGKTSSLESVPDLERAMYLTIDGYPCVRLLNLTGEVGCSNPGEGKIVAPIFKVENLDDELPYLSAVVISAELMQDFFSGMVSTDILFAEKVAGVLIASSTYGNISAGSSPAKKFPQAEFAPYNNLNYEWNPHGSGIMWNCYDFPVFLLSEGSTSTILEMASRNGKVNTAYPVIVAEFDLVMQTQKLGTHNSESCLKERSCLPLGGYSVWSALPPLKLSSMATPKHVVFVVASQDSASFFRDRSLGADSSLSGLIALLAAVDALSHAVKIDEFHKQLVFAVFTGESWGYLGSRRFLQELDAGSNAANGLDGALIDQVIEIGSVGKALSEAATTFYAHPVQGSSSSTMEILQSLEMASESLGNDKVLIRKAAGSNPGIPPSSMMSFVNKNSSVSGVVLEDFDSSFTNRFYHSHLDGPSNINSSSISAAAILVARALYLLANGDLKHPDVIALNSVKVNVSLVEELVRCLLTCQPGLSCDLVAKYISVSNACPNHYVGVFLDSTPDTQHPQYADDTSRFIWNFLADRTSGKMNNSISCTGVCPSKDEVCVGAETISGGRCVLSTTRYVPAYSTRLKYQDDLWQVMSVNSSDPMGQVDPVWTESFWNTIGLRAYTINSRVYDQIILLSGVCVTLIAYILVLVTRSFLSKALKRD